ncbi:LysR family transcriptional regulator [Acinetobacter sp. S40]|uniref:LysR family transcriptional regulator n=1 Tax=unclassified Acinetobacter TaxID=196816 RepID=UPI00190B523E|nr:MULTISPECIES: LysR family transcriptional regulator [unclassified Acinetobacter]MBJ9985216.1 LysR family transcriptional regulator [Acinetobacter sp. S40]MBK0063298.1 LysR family transcriptional regulator [Acinetobacter sp. S55]MBK0066790.1 LysR family transcriptional regulator [Acinetobacter sp. S54]
MNNIHDQVHLNHSLELGLFHRIDINLYPLFVAIFEQKSISSAALSQSISQSAASHALQRLRVQLNDEVFVRHGNKMLPTPFAERIYPIVRTALLSIQSISQQKQNFDPSLIKTLRIAIHDEIEPLIFPKVIQHFQQIDPDIQFSSIKLNRKTIQNDLNTQQLDFVIDLENNMGGNIGFNPLVSDRYVICTQQNEITQESYQSAPHIGVSSRRTGILLEDIYLNHNNISRHIFLRCQHYSTALQIIEQNPLAMLTLPKTILEHLFYAEHLKIHELPFQFPPINIGMFYHSDLNENLRYQFLKKEIIALFA